MPKSKKIRPANFLGGPEWALDAAVSDCSTVEEFARKYRKADRFTARGKEYVAVVMNSHYEELSERGYASISHHDSNTGTFVTFFQPKAM